MTYKGHIQNQQGGKLIIFPILSMKSLFTWHLMSLKNACYLRIDSGLINRFCKVSVRMNCRNWKYWLPINNSVFSVMGGLKLRLAQKESKNSMLPNDHSWILWIPMILWGCSLITKTLITRPLCLLAVY